MGKDALFQILCVAFLATSTQIFQPESCDNLYPSDDEIWNAGYGLCETYKRDHGLNFEFCYEDVDKSTGVYAYQACQIACEMDEWTGFSMSWCTEEGREFLGDNLSAQECQDLCTDDCDAVEIWENGVRSCWKCTDYEQVQDYPPHEQDSSYPPHTFIKQQIYRDVCIGGCVNGQVERPDRCDDNNIFDTDICRNNCTKTRCGDGITDWRRGEMCDFNPNADDLCTVDCRLPICGDGIFDSSEYCDYNFIDHVGMCTNECRWMDDNPSDFTNHDECPQNKKKVHKGKCGCNKLDVDLDDDDTLDCDEPPGCVPNPHAVREPCELDCGDCVEDHGRPGCGVDFIMACVATHIDDCDKKYDDWCVDVAIKDCGCPRK